MVGRGLEVLICEAIGKERVKEGVAIFRSRYKEIFIEKTKLLPDVGFTIRELYDRGYAMGVASNKPSYFTSEILKSHKIYDYFKAVLGPDHVSEPKPDPEMIDLSLARMKIAKEEVLYIGDMVLDIESGRRAGVKVCVIPGTSSSQRELREANPDHILNDFKELATFLPPLYS
jgi:HAD superfamily hydrolase (TIGR01509 family)